MAPLTGVVFVVLAVIAFAIGGEPPDADEPVQKIVEHYIDDKDAITASALLAAIAMLFLVWRKRNAEALSGVGETVFEPRPS